MSRTEKFWLGVIVLSVAVCGGCNETQGPPTQTDSIIGWDSVVRVPPTPLP